jgi:hypothetical protein
MDKLVAQVRHPPSPHDTPQQQQLSTMAPGSSSKQRDYDYLFKLVLIGDSGVGKSCLLLRFAVSLMQLLVAEEKFEAQKLK